MAKLVAFVDGKSDAALEAESAALGVDHLLDGVFIGLCHRYRPKNGGPSALIQWTLATCDGPRDRCLLLSPVSCTTAAGAGSRPSAVLEAPLPVFLRVVAERVNAFTAYSRGSLRIGGDRALALRLQAWFATQDCSLPLQASTPRELARLIEGRSDDEIAAAVAVAGVERTLDQVFSGMVSRYLPRSGPRRRSTVEFLVHTEEGPQLRQFVADRERPSWHEGSRESADVRVEIALANLLHLVSGRLDAFSALAQRKLKVRGNLLKASGIQKWFDLST
ncbi:MAG TPA: SCP2 sterol-binding domain-containing protein [Polyangiaceae bacterium]|nr:SCP2 sterol-binding domain-containing protein [Polyangiaceae bacterium]